MSRSNMVILKYRNPSRRETVAVASQLEVECTGITAHVAPAVCVTLMFQEGTSEREMERAAAMALRLGLEPMKMGEVRR